MAVATGVGSTLGGLRASLCQEADEPAVFPSAKRPRPPGVSTSPSREHVTALVPGGDAGRVLLHGAAVHRPLGALSTVNSGCGHGVGATCKRLQPKCSGDAGAPVIPFPQPAQQAVGNRPGGRSLCAAQAGAHTAVSPASSVVLVLPCAVSGRQRKHGVSRDGMGRCPTARSRLLLPCSPSQGRRGKPGMTALAVTFPSASTDPSPPLSLSPLFPTRPIKRP